MIQFYKWRLVNTSSLCWLFSHPEQNTGSNQKCCAQPRGRTDPEAALVLYKRQLGIQDASTTKPRPWEKSKASFYKSFLHGLLTSLFRWALAKLNPQARACISKLSCHVLTQIKHAFSLGQYQWESRNKPETLWPQPSDLTCQVAWIRGRKGPNQSAQPEEILLRRLYRFNKSNNTDADILETAQSLQHWRICKHHSGNFLHCFSDHIFINSISTRQLIYLTPSLSQLKDLSHCVLGN